MRILFASTGQNIQSQTVLMGKLLVMPSKTAVYLHVKRVSMVLPWPNAYLGSM